jgi:hypothetical protein
VGLRVPYLGSKCLIVHRPGAVEQHHTLQTQLLIALVRSVEYVQEILNLLDFLQYRVSSISCFRLWSQVELKICALFIKLSCQFVFRTRQNLAQNDEDERLCKYKAFYLAPLKGNRESIQIKAYLHYTSHSRDFTNISLRDSTYLHISLKRFSNDRNRMIRIEYTYCCLTACEP